MIRACTGVALLAVALGLGGCRRRERPLPAERPASPLEPRRFAAGDPLVVVYADLAGRFQSAPRAADVPAESRAVVRVIDPTVKVGERGDYDRVHVADLTRPEPDGSFVTELVDREQFERRALAALPPGAGSRVALPALDGDADPAALPAHGQVILYGTSWCGACKQVRAWLHGRQVAFIEKDVERDPEAAAELAAKAARAGVAPDRVPIIDVRGRLLVGFDPARLTTVLGEPT